MASSKAAILRSVQEGPYLARGAGQDIIRLLPHPAKTPQPGMEINPIMFFTTSIKIIRRCSRASYLGSNTRCPCCTPYPTLVFRFLDRQSVSLASVTVDLGSPRLR